MYLGFGCKMILKKNIIFFKDAFKKKKTKSREVCEVEERRRSDEEQMISGKILVG